MSDESNIYSSGKVGEFITLDYQDGPLLSAALVEFDKSFDEHSLIEIECTPYEVNDVRVPPRPITRAKFRLGRNDLQRMLDMLDGKDVTDFNDDLRTPQGEIDLRFIVNSGNEE
jgi:hypothetical protein